MNKYDSYKDSGVEWIGEIPERWNIVRLKHIVQIKICDGPHETPDWVEAGVPFISAEAIRGNKIDFKFKRGDITIEQHKEYTKKSKVKKGDILFCKAGSTTGKSAMVDINDDFGIWSPLAIIRANSEKVDNYYLFHSIQSDIFRKEVETAWTFGTQPNIGMGSLENLWVVLPNSLFDQKIIANYLDRKTTEIDDLISKKERLINLLEEEKTAVINQAVTKGLNPAVPMKDSGMYWLGEVPEHWELRKLKHNCQLISNKTSNKPEYVLALENIESWSGKIIGNPFLNEMMGDVSIFEKGDILFSKLRPYLAKVHLPERNGGCVGEILILRPNEDVYSEFLFYRLISKSIISIVDNSTYGTKMPRASWEKFISHILIGIPPIEEQIKIVKHIQSKLKNMIALKNRIDNEISLLQEYKTALISEVVTGKVDVREAVLVN